MRTALALVALVFAAPSGQNPSSTIAAACTTATDACTEWVTLGGGPARSLVYRTRPFDKRDDRMRRALIMVHGTNRNADHYFETATAAAFLAHALDDTIVIAPRIASAAGNCRDTLAAN